MKPGYIKGKHYTEFYNKVLDLKKTGKFDDAIKLLLQLVDATEAESKADDTGVAPWYYEQLAIIYRKLNDYENEVSILERFSKQSHAPGLAPQKLLDRLNKVR